MLGNTKKASEVEALQRKLDQLKADQVKRSAEATTAEAAQIAEAEAALKAAKQVAFEQRQAQHKAEQDQARADYDETLHAIVDATTELRGLLGALKERRRQAAALGIIPPNDFCVPFEQAINAMFWNWDRYRPELTGAPPQPSRLEVAILETRGDVARTEKSLKDTQEKLAAFLGDRGSIMHRDLVRLATDYAGDLQRERRRLAELLAQVEPQTDGIRRERLALEQRIAERQVISLPV